MTGHATPTPAEPELLRAFVNERGVSAPRGSTALDVVRAFDPAIADAIAAGTQRLTDSRGLPIEPSAPAHGGAIYRTLPVRATAAELAAELGASPDATT
jgi:hypothetical protein